ncbi:MAG: HAMP domain-containing histidine kinase [Defluviitaleaceae bacterium]|nr:HAMP domain-containing histidine kinase [Defluviitaleaceae bacterium]
MKSFTKKLILNCTGVIFLSFLVVYILFNAMVHSYIRAEAEQELSLGIRDAEDISQRIYLSMTTRTINENGQQFDLVYAPRIRIREPHPDYHIWSIETLEPNEDFHMGQFTVRLGQAYNFRPMRRSIISTGTIMLNTDSGEIIMPQPEFMPDNQSDKVEFLANFYLTNRELFANEEMVIATSANSTHYLRAVDQVIESEPISILLYTDISSAIAFMNGMNYRLILMLVLSGLASLTIAALMSARFKKAINRLCLYAETIGRGNFNEKAGTFHDTEFVQLSKSMDNMSKMLQAYENNQKQFFQNASHELRTPLMSIQGYAEGIIGDIFNKDEAASIIVSEGQKMADLVSELLFVSRMDRETPCTISSAEINNLLYDCHERIRPIAAKAGINVSVNAPYTVTIATDEEKLERAVINILSNAIRYAKSEVIVNCYVKEDTVEIEIKDDGKGIAPADLPHIFERFYKGENGNFGLGLAISKDIIKSLQGDIVAKNSTKNGAVFVITLRINTDR